MKTLPAEEQEAARGFFTTIRRAPGGRFVTVPYSLEYQGELAEAARLLREAAARTAQPTLRAFLEKRADAFLTNDYYASDVAWMELDATIEPTIGPYEVYEDGWLAAKAAFEAFVTLRDDVETRKLARFAASCRGWKTTCPSSRSTGTPASVLSLPSAWSTWCSRRGMATAVSRPRPSTSPTTSGWSRRRAPSA